MDRTTLTIRTFSLTCRNHLLLVLIVLCMCWPYFGSGQCSVSQTGINASATEFCQSPFTVSFTADVQRDTTPVLLSVQQAPGNFQAPFNLSFPKQNNGCVYYLEMNGSAGLWLGSNRADAYAKFNGNDNSVYGPPGMANWFLSALPTSGLTAYDPQHKYKLGYTGDGNTLTFNFTDNPYSDNSGAVSFKWYGIPCYNYHWDFGDGNASTVKAPSHTYSMNGNYTVVLTVTDLLNNCSDTDSLVISTISVPIVDLGADLEHCIGDTIVLSPSNTGVDFLWQDGTTGPTLQVITAGNYSVQASNPCGSAVDSIHIAFDSVPLVELPQDTLVCEGDILVLHSDSEGAHLWQDGSTGSSYFVQSDGQYHLQISNNCGSGWDTVNVEYRYCDCRFFMPNAFSPNNDGINDVFLPIIHCELVDYQIRIYDRWGEELFNSGDPSEAWNGSINDKRIRSDVYVWHIEYSYRLENHNVETGVQEGVVVVIL